MAMDAVINFFTGSPLPATVPTEEEARKTRIAQCAAQLKGVEGEYGVFSLGYLRLKNCFVKLEGSEEDQLKFYGLCMRIKAIAANLGKTEAAPDVNVQKEIAQHYKSLLALAIQKAGDSNRLDHIQAVNFAICQEAGNQFFELTRLSTVVPFLVSNGTKMSVDSLTHYLLNFDHHISQAKEQNPDIDVIPVLLQAIVTTPGFHESIAETLKNLYAGFDLPVDLNEAEIKQMRDVFVLMLNDLIKGNQPITKESLKGIQFREISVIQVLGENLANMVDLLENTRQTYLQVKQLGEDGDKALQAYENNEAAVKNANNRLAAPASFKAEDFVAFPEGEKLIGEHLGKDAFNEIVRFDQLPKLIQNKQNSLVQKLEEATEKLKAAKDEAAAKVVEVRKGLADAKVFKAQLESGLPELEQLIQTSQGVLAKLNQQEAALQKNPNVGIADLKQNQSDHAAALEQLELHVQKRAKYASDLNQITQTCGELTEKLSRAERTAQEAQSAYDSAHVLKQQALEGEIGQLQTELANLEAKTYSLTGNQLVQMKAEVKSQGKIAHAIQAAIAIRVELGELIEEYKRLRSEGEQAYEKYDGARKVLDAQCASLDEQVDNANDNMRQALTKVYIAQRQAQVKFAIVTGHALLEQATRNYQPQVDAMLQKDPHITATYAPEKAIKKLIKKRSGKGLVTFEEKSVPPAAPNRKEPLDIDSDSESSILDLSFLSSGAGIKKESLDSVSGSDSSLDESSSEEVVDLKPNPGFLDWIGISNLFRS